MSCGLKIDIGGGVGLVLIFITDNMCRKNVCERHGCGFKVSPGLQVFLYVSLTTQSLTNLEVQLMQLNHCDGVYSNY